MQHDLEQPSPIAMEEVLLLLERHCRSIVLGGVVGLVLGLGAAQLLTPQFVATSELVFEPSTVPKEYVRSSVQERGAEAEGVVRRRLMSDSVLDDAVDRAAAAARGDRAIASLTAGSIRENLEVVLSGSSRSQGTQVLTISYRSNDPAAAAGVLRAVVDAFTEGEAEHRAAEARATERFLSAEVERVGARLLEREEALLEARAKLPIHLRRGRDSNQEGSDPRSAALRKLSEELAVAESLYTSAHPAVQNLRSQIARIERRERSSSGEDSEIGRIAQYDEASADHGRVQGSYDKLVSRHIDALVASNLEAQRAQSRFRELRAPIVPKSAAFPKPSVFAAGGLVAGIGLVCFFVIAYAWWRPRYGDVASLEDALGAPVVACIPRVDPRPARSEAPDELSPLLVTVSAPNSAAAEQYRAFVPHYLDEKQPRVVLVTSSSPGDGKSLTAANLAATLSTELSSEVLLVDADLRRPTAHYYFGASRRPGLADVLSAEATLEEALRPTAVPRLSLLPAGSPARLRAAWFADARFAEFIDVARARFGTIVLDSPPVLPLADARVLGRLAEMVILVVRASATPREAVGRCLDTLGEVSGVIFNDASASSYYRAYTSYPTENYGSE